jgi:hypothetical protein
LPALVMPPWRRVSSLACSDGTRPRNAMSWRGLAKRAMSPSSATTVAAPASAMPRSACGALTTGASDQSGSAASMWDSSL